MFQAILAGLVVHFPVEIAKIVVHPFDEQLSLDSLSLRQLTESWREVPLWCVGYLAIERVFDFAHGKLFRFLYRLI